MDFNSKWKEINASPKSVFLFLKDLRNLENLMPEQIIDFKAEENRCSFTIKGMTSLSLVIDEALEYQRIKLIPEGKSPFEFELIAHIKSSNDQAAVKISLNASLNPMLAMMAKRPLQNLVEIMAEKLSLQKF
ncbi:MAG: hypothetical protein KJ578_14545 [Bacteroidetes bacterium]|nr:hypothetical protein [Bacteroidota bacterium]MBU1578357.1 hypothetical protein [Bacteroidota bacterium]MBU2466271.1 hypothetical protein [Bacteroidota bacterium]MBU2558994.1 hypothetical protein [Bacteroidota bacterium]